VSDDQRTLVQALHDISTMIIQAAEMHRMHTRLLITLLEVNANHTDIISGLRANEELFCGFLTRISALSDMLRIAMMIKGEQ
jgi:hypothetical protein